MPNDKTSGPGEGTNSLMMNNFIGPAFQKLKSKGPTSAGPVYGPPAPANLSGGDDKGPGANKPDNKPPENLAIPEVAGGSATRYGLVKAIVCGDMPTLANLGPQMVTQMAISRGMLNGANGDGSKKSLSDLHLGDRVNRAEATKIAVQAGGSIAKLDTSRIKHTFDDLPASHWAAPHVYGAVRVGGVTAPSAKAFDPGGYLPFAQLADFINRAKAPPGEDFALFDPTMAVPAAIQQDQAKDPPSTAQNDKVRKEFSSLTGFGEGFFTTAGAAVDALVPVAGDRKKLDLSVKVPAGTAGVANAFVVFDFVAECENKGGTIKLGTEVGLSVRGEVDAWLVEAWAQAGVTGYLNARGGDGRECFRIVGLAIQQGLASVSQRAADWLFDPDFADSVAKDMDGDDSLEYGIGGKAQVGVGNSAAKTKTSISGKQLFGTKVTSDGNGGLKKEEHNTTALDFDLSSHGAKFHVGGKLETAAGKLKKVSLKVYGEQTLQMADLSASQVIGQWIMGAAGTAVSVLQDPTYMKGSAVKKAATIADMIQDNTGTLIEGALASKPLGGALADKAPFAKAGYRLTLDVTSSASGTVGGVLTLDRVTKLEFGDDIADTVRLKLESLDRVFRLPLVGK